MTVEQKEVLALLLKAIFVDEVITVGHVALANFLMANMEKPPIWLRVLAGGNVRGNEQKSKALADETARWFISWWKEEHGWTVGEKR